MKIDLSKKETKLMIEMLSMVGYMLGDTSKESLAKAEQMHELIQKVYTQAINDEKMDDSFEKDNEVGMLFPSEKLMNQEMDSPLTMIHMFSDAVSLSNIAQKLAIRDALKELGFDSANNPEFTDLPDEFFELFPKKEDYYAKEFSKNGFDNVKVSQIQLIT